MRPQSIFTHKIGVKILNLDVVDYILAMVLRDCPDLKTFSALASESCARRSLGRPGEASIDGCVIVMAVAYQIKDRRTVRIDDNRLTIDHT